jgi:hypothetical protein
VGQRILITGVSRYLGADLRMGFGVLRLKAFVKIDLTA